MSHVRAIARLATIAAWSAGAWLALVVVGPPRALLRRLRGLPPAPGPWQTRVFRRWAAGTAALLGMRCETVGEPPAAPFFLVTNHLGYVDIVLLARQLDCTFVAKSDVAGWPVVGALCRSVDTIFIDRTNKRDIPRVMERIERGLASGRGVVVFPEGTSTPGDRVERFRPSLLDAAARSGRPVHWASVEYLAPDGYPPARESICWWGDMGFLDHLYHLVRLPGFAARLTFGANPIVASDRKELANRLQNAVEGVLRPVGGTASKESS